MQHQFFLMLQKYWVDKMCEMSEVKTKVDIGHFFLEGDLC